MSLSCLFSPFYPQHFLLFSFYLVISFHFLLSSFSIYPFFPVLPIHLLHLPSLSTILFSIRALHLPFSYPSPLISLYHFTSFFLCNPFNPFFYHPSPPPPLRRSRAVGEEKEEEDLEGAFGCHWGIRRSISVS
ncbi:hypothetical protein E2C01_092567 [Portunus trituberculatus]|uniref:Uncharacterized protein n=1 Tax=Portunus trituberculatus TaxID=210409 RepID=A0A5B7JS32_PORTR|nr:hypothetical protein [Portunus trituberculatus]